MNEEDPLSMAERHVREGEARVAHQAAIVEKLAGDGHSPTAITARRLLAILETTLTVARDHVRIERERRGIEE